MTNTCAKSERDRVSAPYRFTSGPSCSILQRFLLRCTGEDVVHAVVALVTRVLVDAVVAPLHRNLSGPGPGPGRGILDGELVQQCVRIDAPKPLTRCMFALNSEVVMSVAGRKSMCRRSGVADPPAANRRPTDGGCDAWRPSSRTIRASAIISFRITQSQASGNSWTLLLVGAWASSGGPELKAQDTRNPQTLRVPSRRAIPPAVGLSRSTNPSASVFVVFLFCFRVSMQEFGCPGGFTIQ